MNDGCDSGLLSVEQADAPRLSFDSHEAALDFAKQGVEETGRFLARHSLDLADHYKHMKCEVVTKCRSMRDASEYHLIFRAVPLGWPRDEAGLAGTAEESLIESGVTNGVNDGKNDFMFVGITQLVQSPEGTIPSFVWLKRHHHVKDFFRYVLGAPLSRVVLTSNGGFVATEREVGVVAGFASSDSSSISGSIERGAQMAEDFKGDPWQGGWEGFGQLDLMRILSSVGIWFNDSGVWVAVDEASHLSFKLLDTSLGILDA